jgi:hypothetical protein
LNPSAHRSYSWRIPLWIASASVVALVSGLLGDGVFDVLAWCGLLIPVGVIAHSFRQGKS